MAELEELADLTAKETEELNLQLDAANAKHSDEAKRRARLDAELQRAKVRSRPIAAQHAERVSSLMSIFAAVLLLVSLHFSPSLHLVFY